ncbi:MAG: leucine-rich repeat domain-containing protein [Eubacteriales bacterium]|nr:leucine-rich repeat domain-containing protein [Eubacteriales bacterium]
MKRNKFLFVGIFFVLCTVPTASVCAFDEVFTDSVFELEDEIITDAGEVFSQEEIGEEEIFTSENEMMDYPEAGSFTVNGICYQTDEGGKTCGIVGYTEDVPSEITLEAKVNDLRVSWIGDYAFKDCIGLTSVVVDAALEQIGMGIFDGCENVTITCYEQTAIREALAESTIQLNILEQAQNIEIEGVKYNLTTMYGDGYHYSALVEGDIVQVQEVVCGLTVNSVAGVKKSIKYIEIPDTVVYLGDDLHHLFRDSDIREINIPDSVNWIESRYIAENCQSLKTVSIGNGMKLIDVMYFANCSSLETVIIGTGITEIERGAFFNCPNLKEVYIPENVKYIYPSAFEKCNSKLVIVGYTGSYAENYAKGMGFTFRSVGQAQNKAPVVLKKAKVSGNTISVSAAVSDVFVQGYDYILKDIYSYYDEDDNIVEYNESDVSAQNNLKSGKTAVFPFVQSGTYYVNCRGWIKDKNGNKQYTDWSNPIKVRVTADTPSTPKILSVKVKGNTVTVTVLKDSAADFDCVLGSSRKKTLSYYKCNGTLQTAVYQTKPENYKYVLKNKKVKTIVFKNVKKGTYYVGVHAYNREGGKGAKVFSMWSGTKRVTIK